MLKSVTQPFSNVEIQCFDGLTIDFARKNHAQVMIRGLRAVTDFEYELQMSQINHALNSNIETVFLTTRLEYAYLSSSTVKEVAAMGGAIYKFVPELVVRKLYEKYGVSG